MKRAVPVILGPQRLLGDDDVSEVTENVVDPLGVVWEEEFGELLLRPEDGSSAVAR